MCDICDGDFSHREGCPLDFAGEDPVCSVCCAPICDGERYIYRIGGIESGIICEECIEHFSVEELLEVCGIESVVDIISELSGKVMRAGDTY